MKKLIALVAVFFISGAIALYGKRINNLIFEKAKAKTVKFSIYAGSDYSASLYKKSKATVFLTVYKYAGHERTIVWEGKVDERNLKNYPASTNPLLREVCIYNVLESRETIVATYKVVYDSKESKLMYEDGIILSHEAESDTLSIAI